MIPGVVVTADGGLAFDPEIADDASHRVHFAFTLGMTDDLFDRLMRITTGEPFVLNGYFG